MSAVSASTALYSRKIRLYTGVSGRLRPRDARHVTAYSEHETRPDGDLAVVFFSRTYAVRLFETAGNVRSFYPGDPEAMRREVFLEPADLLRVFTPGRLAQLVDRLTRDYPARLHDARDRAAKRPDFDPQVPVSVARALWQVLQQVGDRVSGSAGKSKSKREGFRFDLSRLQGPGGDALMADFTRQARAILEEVRTNGKAAMSKDEVEKLVLNMAVRGRLKTKQDPCLVFYYYCPQFADAGLLEYPGRRKRGEDDDGPEEGGGETLMAAE